LIYHLNFDRFTSKSTEEGDAIYAISTQWPAGDRLKIGAPVPVDDQTIVTILGYGKPSKVRFKLI
jgi:hypothetical protein